MPPSLMRRAAGPLIDRTIGVVERAIELIGDPDLRDSIERDRRALRLSHERLVEALEEIEDLRSALRVATDELAKLREENRRCSCRRHGSHAL